MDWDRLPRFGDPTLNRRGFVPLEPPGAELMPRMPVPGAGPARVPVPLPEPAPAALTSAATLPDTRFPPPMVAKGAVDDPNSLTPVQPAATMPRKSTVSDAALAAANALTIRGGNSTKPFTREDLEAENPNAQVRVRYPGDERPNYRQMDSLARYMQATQPRGRAPSGADLIGQAYLQAVLAGAGGIADKQKRVEFIMGRLGDFMGKNSMAYQGPRYGSMEE
jgi:hypothetical protein